MYDFNREPIVALGGFINQSICFYLPSSNRIQILQKKSYNYENENKNQMIEMADNIFKQLFYYSKSLEKVNSKQQKLNVLDILFENIKRIIIFNGDKYGIIPQQRSFYLILSYLYSKLNKKHDNRQFLNQVHWLLITVNSDQSQQLPFAFTALLNGQFEQLLEYIKQKFCPQLPISNLQSLIDLLIYKIQQSQSDQPDKNSKDKIYQKLKKTISTNNRFNSLKKQLKDATKKNSNSSIYNIFQGQYELELIISILAGNQQIIQLISKKSWAIYLNLYINYVQPIKDQTKNKVSYSHIATQFIKRINVNNKKSTNYNNNLSEQQRFIIDIIDTCSSNRTHSFHEIYQNSFNIFSPFLSHLLGTLMLQSKLVDLFSIFNNKDYYQQISLSLLESASEISWSSLVHMIGYLQYNQYFQQAPHMISLWQSLLFKYLPYDLSSKDHLDIRNQIKQIQQKIQDLNMIGLKYITKSYLNTVFKLEINPKNSFNKLNPIILQLFFMNLQIPDNNNANQCMHEMKIFMKNYYKNYQFDYRMIDNLQNLFEKKQNILDKKTISKIHSLFKLIYKIGQIYSETVIPIQVQNQLEQKKKVINQIIKFNNLFSYDNHKSITLCVELLKLGKYLLEKILSQNLQCQQDNQTQMKIQTQQTQNQNQQISKAQNVDKIIKNFKRNLIQYIKEWKYNTPENNNIFGEDALELLKYYHQYLY